MTYKKTRTTDRETNACGIIQDGRIDMQVPGPQNGRGIPGTGLPCRAVVQRREQASGSGNLWRGIPAGMNTAGGPS